MTVPVLADVVLSNSVISAGIRGKNMRKNSRVPTDSGAENINIVWTQTLRQYELGIVPLQRSDWLAIEALHEVTEGGAYGFLMQDPKDSTTLSGVLSTVSAGVYQLQNRRIHAGSSRYKDRKITRPRASGFILLADGLPVSGGSYTLDVTTGRVTTAASGTLTWTGAFYTPVHFMDDAIDWTLIAAGPSESRFWSGPSVMLQEIRE